MLGTVGVVADHEPSTPSTDRPPIASAGPEADGDARRSQLLAVKLRALVGDHLSGRPGDRPGDRLGDMLSPAQLPGFAPGAATMVDRQAWVLLDHRTGRQAGQRSGQRPGQRLGSALAWAIRRDATELHLITEADGGQLARRAAEFAFPVTVWLADGRRLLPAGVEPLPEPAAAPADHLALRELIAAGGATPLVEHGVVSGEVRGLEVCRVVDDEEEGARLEIGVGVHDREAFQMLHGNTPTIDSLSRVVDAVREHRVPGAARHPFNRMAAERLLRWRVEDDPSRLGLRTVTAAEPPVARTSAVEAVPCVARGTDRDGRDVVVVCSSGVDLDVVPYAADARLAAGEVADPGVARTLVVTPARDRLAVTTELAGLLVQSLELVSID